MSPAQKKAAMTETEAMDNCKLEVSDNILIIKVALDVSGTESASGKSIVLGSTRGNKDIPGMPGFKIGVNCYKQKH
jgi:hypothetical protein